MRGDPAFNAVPAPLNANAADRAVLGDEDIPSEITARLMPERRLGNGSAAVVHDFRPIALDFEDNGLKVFFHLHPRFRFNDSCRPLLRPFASALQLSHRHSVCLGDDHHLLPVTISPGIGPVRSGGGKGEKQCDSSDSLVEKINRQKRNLGNLEWAAED